MIEAGELATLVQNHRRFLSFLEARLGDRDEAEELLQTAYAKALDATTELRSGEFVVAWFYRLLRNATIDHYRRRGAEQRSKLRLVAEVPSDEPSGDWLAEVCRCVTTLLDTVPPHYRELLERVDLRGEVVSHVAASLGLTPGNARVRLHRARHALRARLVQSCGTCADHGCLDCRCERSPVRA